MKAKKVVLVSGEVYEEVNVQSVKERELPEEMDAMIEVTSGNQTIYINAAMIVSLELDTRLRSV